MKNRKSKKGDIASSLVALSVLFFISNPSKAQNIFTMIMEFMFIALLIGAIGCFIYWIYSNSKLEKANLESRKQIFQYQENAKLGSHKPTFQHQEKTINHNVSVDQHHQVNELKWSKELIDSLEWKCFEDLCAEYFKEKGYKANVTKLGADGGVDIYIFKESYSSTKPFGIVQCKAWNTYKVGVKPVRELFGVMVSERTPLGIFITSGTYTKEAEEFSKGKNLKLLSGSSLLKLIESLPEENQNKLLKNITKGDYSTPSCPSCGIKMVIRNGRNKFWGCVKYPKCRNTLILKKAS
jgi:HJR/Mrr/RecB family endonuclease